MTIRRADIDGRFDDLRDELDEARSFIDQAELEHDPQDFIRARLQIRDALKDVGDLYRLVDEMEKMGAAMLGWLVSMASDAGLSQRMIEAMPPQCPGFIQMAKTFAVQFGAQPEKQTAG